MIQSLYKTYNGVTKITLVALLAIFAFSCKKEVEIPLVAQTPGVIEMSPVIGPKGTILNFSGNNFPEGSQIQVKVNGVAAPVVSSTSNQIQATVPSGAGSGAVQVTFNGTTYNPGNFEYTYVNFTVKSLTNGTYGFLDGPLATAQFNALTGLAIDGSDNVYSAEGDPFAPSAPRLRKINIPALTVTTIAGNGTIGDVDAQGTAARFGAVRQLSAMANGTVFMADRTNRKIKKVDPAGNVTTFATLTYVPEGIKVAKSGNVYVTSPGGATSVSVIQKYNGAGALQWTVTSHSIGTTGLNTSTGNLNGDSSIARFTTRNGIEVDDAETTLYFAHILGTNNYATQIKMLDLKSFSISTLAGDVANAQSTSDGPALSAGLNWVTSMALDNNGGLYIADYFGMIRYINHGIVRTIIQAGAGTDGTQDTASDVGAWGIVRDSKGNFVYTDYDMNKLRYLTRVN